mgnify:CR=1 FL=1
MAASNIGQAYYPQHPFISQGHSPAHARTAAYSASKRSAKEGTTFAGHLQQAIAKPPLTFSAHAQTRLAERKIELSEHQLQRLNSGVEKARKKGARETLIIMDEAAFVVSVKNQKVITAMDKPSMTEQVITNIDSTIWL